MLHASPAGNDKIESGHQSMAMKVLIVHPGALLYTKVFLRLEPLGMELIAAAVRRAGHQVRLVDLQVERGASYERALESWRPEVVLFSCNYLANVPEVIDRAKQAVAHDPDTFVVVGGHSASFVADELLEHGAGAISCVLKGEGEASVVALLDARAGGEREALLEVPGAITLDGRGPAPRFVKNLDELLPARSVATSAQILHRRARPLCVDRAFTRLPVGLLVLQRVDVLRTQLSRQKPCRGCR